MYYEYGMYIYLRRVVTIFFFNRLLEVVAYV